MVRQDQAPSRLVPLPPSTPQEAREHQAAWAKHLDVDVEFTNSIGMKLMLIPPGEFLMGSPDNETGRDTDEYQHRVRITKPFYLGKFEVTQAQYAAGNGDESQPFQGIGHNRPVEQVCGKTPTEFCRRLSALPEEKGRGGCTACRRRQNGSTRAVRGRKRSSISGRN